MSTEAEDTIKTLRDELETVASLGSAVWSRQEWSRRLRFNEWVGQSLDGRRHGEALGGEALPFEGAPDNRIPLIDGAVNEKVAVAKRAFFRGMVQAKPENPADAPRAANISSLCSWLRDRAMRDELEKEVPLSAQHMFGDDPGLAIVEVTWRQDLALVRRSLTFDELAEMWSSGAQSPEQSQEAAPPEPEMLAEFMDLATNPERNDEFLQWLGVMFPGATKKALRGAAKDLRTQGSAELPVPAIRNNRPGVCTLKFFDDVFFPIGTCDIQRARGIDRREWLSEVELRERVHTLGWDASDVETIIEKGKGQSVLSSPQWRRTQTGQVLYSGQGRVPNERDNLFEIWWSYRREADELGVPGIVCTVWSGVVKDSYLKRNVAEYPHGGYPFCFRPRENLGRQTTDSRGLGVAIATHQNEMKVQRDARGVAVQMRASPPMKTRITRGAFELVLGPNAQIPVQKMDDFDVVTLPDFLQNSVEMEKVTHEEAMDHCALMRPDADPNRIGLFQQDEADTFIGLWREVMDMVLGLAQTYYSEAELDRVTGQADMPLHLTPEDVRGKWGVSIEIDMRDLNFDFVMKKMDGFGKVLSYDTGGVLDRSQFAQWGARSIDPILAGLTIQPSGAVTQKMIDEERNNVTGMALGIEPVMNPGGTTNPQFRMQTVMQTIGQSPKLAQLWQGDPLFRGLVENYQKYLMQQNVQEENKLVGRLGTQPTQSAPGMYAAPAALPAA